MSELQRALDRIDELETLLGLGAAAPRIAGLRPTAARVLFLLISCQRVTKYAVYDALYGERSDDKQPQPKIIDVHLTHVRNALRGYGVTVHNVWAEGWFITSADRDRLKKLLAENGQVLPPANLLLGKPSQPTVKTQEVRRAG